MLTNDFVSFEQLAQMLKYLSHKVRKCTFGRVHPAKIQISLCIQAIHTVW